MLRRNASLIVALFLVLFVAGACLVQSGRPVRRGQPSHIEAQKHKKEKQQKHKKAKKQKKYKD